MASSAPKHPQVRRSDARFARSWRPTPPRASSARVQVRSCSRTPAARASSPGRTSPRRCPRICSPTSSSTSSTPTSARTTSRSSRPAARATPSASPSPRSSGEDLGEAAQQRPGARLPARDGPGLAADARGRGRDRPAHRGRRAPPVLRDDRHALRHPRGAAPGRPPAQGQVRAQVAARRARGGGRGRGRRGRGARRASRPSSSAARSCWPRSPGAPHGGGGRPARRAPSRTRAPAPRRASACARELAERYQAMVNLLLEVRFSKARLAEVIEGLEQLARGFAELRARARALDPALPALARGVRGAGAALDARAAAAAARRWRASAATRELLEKVRGELGARAAPSAASSRSSTA